MGQHFNKEEGLLHLFFLYTSCSSFHHLPLPIFQSSPVIWNTNNPLNTMNNAAIHCFGIMHLLASVGLSIVGSMLSNRVEVTLTSERKIALYVVIVSVFLVFSYLIFKYGNQYTIVTIVQCEAWMLTEIHKEIKQNYDSNLSDIKTTFKTSINDATKEIAKILESSKKKRKEDLLQKEIVSLKQKFKLLTRENESLKEQVKIKQDVLDYQTPLIEKYFAAFADEEFISEMSTQTTIQPTEKKLNLPLIEHTTSSNLLQDCITNSSNLIKKSPAVQSKRFQSQQMGKKLEKRLFNDKDATVCNFDIHLTESDNYAGKYDATNENLENDDPAIKGSASQSNEKTNSTPTENQNSNDEHTSYEKFRRCKNLKDINKVIKDLSITHSDNSNTENNVPTKESWKTWFKKTDLNVSNDNTLSGCEVLSRQPIDKTTQPAGNSTHPNVSPTSARPLKSPTNQNIQSVHSRVSVDNDLQTQINSKEEGKSTSAELKEPSSTAGITNTQSRREKNLRVNQKGLYDLLKERGNTN